MGDTTVILTPQSVLLSLSVNHLLNYKHLLFDKLGSISSPHLTSAGSPSAQ